jgi:hypothetical protein
MPEKKRTAEMLAEQRAPASMGGSRLGLRFWSVLHLSGCRLGTKAKMTYILEWATLLAVGIGLYVIGRIADKREAKPR